MSVFINFDDRPATTDEEGWEKSYKDVPGMADFRWDLLQDGVLVVMRYEAGAEPQVECLYAPHTWVCARGESAGPLKFVGTTRS